MLTWTLIDDDDNYDEILKKVDLAKIYFFHSSDNRQYFLELCLAYFSKKNSV